MRKLVALFLGLFFLVIAGVTTFSHHRAHAEERWVCYKVTRDSRGNPRKTAVDINSDAIGGDGTVEAKTNKAKLVCVRATSGVLNGSEGESEGAEQ